MAKNDKTLALISRAARGLRRIHVLYRRNENVPRSLRIFEPYALAPAFDDWLLLTYQLEPTEGWRFYRLGQCSLASLGQSFEPRRGVAVAQTKGIKRPKWKWRSEMRDYLGMVIDALADMEVSQTEAEALDRYRQDARISPEEMLGVHYAILHSCLTTILSDGLVHSGEASELQKVNALLKRCGAGVGE